MNPYKTEKRFAATSDNSLVFNLRSSGRSRKGPAQWENDVAISITAHHLTDEQRADIADTIRDAMNAKFVQSDRQNTETSADSSSSFIVQERYRGHGATWLDDPDQPPHTERSFELAKDWMILDTETPGHAIAYDHRIIERRFAILFQTDAQGDSQSPAKNL